MVAHRDKIHDSSQHFVLDGAAVAAYTLAVAAYTLKPATCV